MVCLGGYKVIWTQSFLILKKDTYCDKALKFQNKKKTSSEFKILRRTKNQILNIR